MEMLRKLTSGRTTLANRWFGRAPHAQLGYRFGIFVRCFPEIVVQIVPAHQVSLFQRPQDLLHSFFRIPNVIWG
jgi:hypothetical protein